MKSFLIKCLYAGLCASLLLAVGKNPTPVHAATTIIVNSTDDSPTLDTCATTGAGTCTLRDAITYANNNAETTITFAAGLADKTITLGSTLNINDDMTIDGSKLPSPMTISGNNQYNVMRVASGSVVLDSLDIENGSSIQGSGIYNLGTLTIANSTFSGNRAGDRGGGIWNSGMLTVTNSTVSGNDAGDGGGIWNSGTLTVANSYLSNSAVSDGGGIYNGGTLTVANSTFYGNSAGDYGGGIYNGGTLTVVNSTLADNSTFAIHGSNSLGSNIFNFATFNLVNTIIADAYGVGGDCAGINAKAAKNNLIDDSANACGLTNGTDGNIIGVDPNLDFLNNNGGPTLTMALPPSSPAVNAGDDTTCQNPPVDDLDQRGIVKRSLQGAHCDIGAYEYSGKTTPKVTSSTPSNKANMANGLTTITVTFNQGMVQGSSSAADNPDNYLLVERGINKIFDTFSCKAGVQGDDMQVALSGITYNNSNHTATLTVPALAPGSYQLFVCGTTSIWSMTGLELNNGADVKIDFTITAASASALPLTGFPTGQMSLLPLQTTDTTYSSTPLTLDIPELGVRAPIVGVPRSGASWDVSWLGNDAGWLDGSAYPTWSGNTVLTGHVWNADNTPGIFVNLNKLKYGDRFEIEAYGQTYTYEVRESTLISKGNVAAVFKHEDLDWVTLLSCEQYDQQSGTYLFRRLVQAVLADVK